MRQYHHQISGFFSHRDQAETAYAELLKQGIAAAQLTLRDTDSTPSPTASLADNQSSNDVLKAVLVSTAIGVGIGSAAGLAAQLALTAANINLFIASPLIAPLVLIGWGASIGGFIGAVMGTMKKRQSLTQLVQEKILNGQIALVVDTHDRQQTAAAKAVMDSAVGGYKNVRVD
ncbi:MAG: hypothetical protein U1B30_11290 [Pseudomonadota bacterium]|nr:hypothetical protein [Pseudomonadota bacterium]